MNEPNKYPSRHDPNHLGRPQSTFQELKPFIGITLFAFTACIISAWLSFLNVEEMDSVDPGAMWCSVCEKITYETDREYIQLSSFNSVLVCATCGMQNLTTKEAGNTEGWLMIGVSILTLIGGASFCVYWARLNKKLNVYSARK